MVAFCVCNVEVILVVFFDSLPFLVISVHENAEKRFTPNGLFTPVYPTWGCTQRAAKQAYVGVCKRML